MLLGEYQINLGDKNRIALPKKIRDELGNKNLVITRGYEGCAIMLDINRWQQLINQIRQSALFNLSVRDTKRYLLGGATQVELDIQGRFVIAGYILEHLQADKELILIGVGEWMELWSMEKWQAKVDYLVNNAADIAEKLAEQ